MKRKLREPFFCAIVASSLLIPAQVGATMTDEASDIAAILDTNSAILRAVKESDADSFKELTMDELRVLAPGGRLEDKAMVIKGLGTVVGDLELSEEEVTVAGDTAMMTGKLQGNAVMEPFGKLPPMKFIATFVRTEEGWRMLSRAITPCAQVAIDMGVC